MMWMTRTSTEGIETMKMYNPPHPGEIIKGLWLDPMGAAITDAARAMGVSRKTLSKIVNGRGRVTPEIALRLSVALGSSAESWLGHQGAYQMGNAAVNDEQRDFIMGYSLTQRLLLVIYTERGERTRIISAWLATRSERKLYEETCQETP